MALPPLVAVGDPVLRAPARPVPKEQLGTQALRELVSTLVEVMRGAPGVGLAAPQIGVPWRLFVVEDSEERMALVPPELRAERERTPLPVQAFINPTVRPVGTEQVTFFEGCLSVPGYTALVPRFREVEVEGLDVDGRPLRLLARGWPARIFQHEMDHLEGTVYVDRMLSRSFCTTEQAHARYARLKVEEVKARLGL